MLKRLKNEFTVKDFVLEGKNFRNGRISGQEYFDLSIGKRDKKRLMRISLYHGDPPNYQPWVELFSIVPVLKLGDKRIDYFGSDVEYHLLDLISDELNEGGRIFVEYYEDQETMDMLSIGVPEPCTRLGDQLFRRGFTWFKDWYFAEGFNEGGQKLQAEKPIDEEHETKHLKEIKEEAEKFLENEKEYEKTGYTERAFERAREILKDFDSTDQS